LLAWETVFRKFIFSIISARKDENWLVLGDLMGSVIVCATLVLGTIALISPFVIKDLSPFFNCQNFFGGGRRCVSVILLKAVNRSQERRIIFIIDLYYFSYYRSIYFLTHGIYRLH